MKYKLLLLIMFLGLNMALAQYSLKEKLDTTPVANITIDSTITTDTTLVNIENEVSVTNTGNGLFDSIILYTEDLGDFELNDEPIEIAFDTIDNKTDTLEYNNFSNILESSSSIFLTQNYPNPFDADTEISIVLDKSRFIKLKVYDILGIEVKTLVDDLLPSGTHTIRWAGEKNNGKILPTGTYFFQLSDGYTTLTKMTMFEN